MKYSIVKHKIWVQENERIDALEILQDRQRKFFSFTYKELRKDQWLPLVRWDNLELRPHIDRFDENAVMVEQMPFRSVTLHEIEEFVLMFRKGLLTMNLTNL